MPDIFKSGTDIRVHLRRPQRAFKDGNLFVHEVGNGRNRTQVISKLDGFPASSFNVVAATYAALTAAFPRTRLLVKQKEREFMKTLVTIGPRVPQGYFMDEADYNWRMGVGLDFDGNASQYRDTDCLYLLEILPNLKTIDELAKDAADRRLASLRAHPERFQDLGRILILDLFFANNDRILLNNDEEKSLKLDDNGVSKRGMDPLEYADQPDFLRRSRRLWDENGKWCLRVQNVFFCGDVESGTFNGTDFLPQNCPFSSLTKRLDQQERTEKQLKNWPGDHLQKERWDTTSNRLPTEVIAFLNQHLRARGHPVRFGVQCKLSLWEGLEAARSDLRVYLQGLRRRMGTAFPVGLTSRMSRLGW